MKTLTTVSRIALSLAFTAGIAASAPVMAASKGQTVSPAVGKPLMDAQNLIKGGKFKEAIEKAKQAEGMPNKTPYETYMVDEILAGACVKAQDFACAAKALEASMDTGQVPAEDRTPRLKMLAQLYYSNKNYAKAEDLGAQYLKEQSNDADVQILVAQSAYLQKDYKKSSEVLHNIVRTSDAAGKPVKEETLNLLMSAEYEQKNDAGVESTLEMLASRYPKPQYMKDLIALKERNLRGGTTKTSLDIAVIKYNAGVLTQPKDYTELTELALQDGLPGLAKKVMEKGNAEGVLGKDPSSKDREARLLNMATTQAATDQKNLDKGEAEAGKQKTGDALVKFGEAYWSYGMYDKAIATTEAGIAKGVTNADDAKLRLGIAYLSAGQKAKANDAFKGITPGSVPAQVAALWKMTK